MGHSQHNHSQFFQFKPSCKLYCKAARARYMQHLEEEAKTEAGKRKKMYSSRNQ